MVADLCSGGANVVGRVPGAKVGIIKSHAAGRDVEESGHDDAGILHAIDPFALRQAIDAISHEPIVSPPDEVHYGQQIRRRRHRIE
jgi:hypothetical protein